MPWFWGRGKDDDSSSSYEEYTDSEEEEEDEDEAADDAEDQPGEESGDDSHGVEGEDDNHRSSAIKDNNGILAENVQGNGAPVSDDAFQTPPPKRESNDRRQDTSHYSSDDDDAELAAAAADRGKQRDNVRPMNGKNGAGTKPGSTLASEEDDDSSGGRDEKLAKGVIPEAVNVHDNGDDDDDRGSDGSSPRLRADSALSYGTGVDLDDHDRELMARRDESAAPAEEEPSVREDGNADEEDEDNEEEVTSKAEKRSLLALAAEHDRVDILQAILNEETTSSSPSASGTAAAAAAAADREELLHGSIPPLHIAVSYGSVNATNFLLRNGADPSIRPDVAAIVSAQTKDGGGGAAPMDVPHMKRFDDVSAWELAFGDGSADAQQNRSSWNLFGNGSSSNLDLDGSENSASRRRRRTVQALTNIAPSKREGIRHAFTAEALRCIGSDEVDRLKQLVRAGMPTDIDIGGKTLREWCVELGAQKCQELLQPAAAAAEGVAEPTAALEKRGSIVIDRGEPESVTQLSNRLDELESLSQALSISLDALAEEVSVCNGLLLMGGGASALASHVRSLKATKESRFDELERMQAAWENAEDELAYWIREGGPTAAKIAATVVTPPVNTLRRQSSLTKATSPEDLDAQQRQLKAQVAASEHKIRKLRASIADLSEVCSRDLAEVERRGLSGGITLVRGLREELREIDFQLSEAKNGDATCRTKIRMIQSHINESRKSVSEDADNGNGQSNPPLTSDPALVDPGSELDTTEMEQQTAAPLVTNPSTDPPIPASKLNGVPMESERVLSGQSTAIAVRHGGAQGFFPLSLWQILLRIIGFGDEAAARSNSTHSQVMLL